MLERLHHLHWDGIIETFIPIAADIFLVNKLLDFIGISKQAKDSVQRSLTIPIAIITSLKQFRFRYRYDKHTYFNSTTHSSSTGSSGLEMLDKVWLYPRTAQRGPSSI